MMSNYFASSVGFLMIIIIIVVAVLVVAAQMAVLVVMACRLRKIEVTLKTILRQ